MSDMASLVRLITQSVLLASVWHVTTGYKTGTPPSAHVCREMFPEGHHFDSQIREPPFKITTSSTVYKTSYDKIRVKIEALHGYFIRGVFLQARRSDCTHKEPVGVFKLPDALTQKHFKLVNCLNQSASAVTHRAYNVEKPISKTEVEWYSPSQNAGHVFFVATIAKEQDIFWTGVTSDVIRHLDTNAELNKCHFQKLIDPPNINTTPRPFPPDEKTTTPKSQSPGLAPSGVVLLGAVALISFLLKTCN
ncbi:DFP-like protein [Mya arenaria]|uniref:DFP-like protein n=1 Tax=Mya arenaria TaxID=6604 RepID=A0ABY7FL64_MYAAR|nr:putative defense protein 1 [Mya arenaria]WAR22882.1 DFP-like protein [Mya arenaria]